MKTKRPLIIEELESRVLASASLLEFTAGEWGGVGYSTAIGAVQSEVALRKGSRRDESDEESPNDFLLWPDSGAMDSSKRRDASIALPCAEISLRAAKASVKAQLDQMETAVLGDKAIEAARAFFSAGRK